MLDSIQLVTVLNRSLSDSRLGPTDRNPAVLESARRLPMPPVFPGLPVVLGFRGRRRLFTKKLDFGTPISPTPQLSCVVIGGDFAPVGFLRCLNPLESTSK